MNVSDLSFSQLLTRLRKGIRLRIPPFVIHLKSDDLRIARGIHTLYADYPLLAEALFTDFYIELKPPSLWRRWFRPQASFITDNLAPFAPMPKDQAFAFFEWGLNWCFAQHSNHCLVLHAAVVEKNGCAVILPAPPGSGKSTLCAGLVSRGWRLLSDELAMVELETGQLVPVPRPISLKNTSIDVMREFAPDMTMGEVVLNTTKGSVAHLSPPPASLDQADILATPRWVILPKYDAESDSCLEPLAKAHCFMLLIKNAFNYNVLGERGFEVMGDLIDRSDCYSFTYSDLNDAIALFDKLAAEA